MVTCCWEGSGPVGDMRESGWPLQFFLQESLMPFFYPFSNLNSQHLCSLKLGYADCKVKPSNVITQVTQECREEAPIHHFQLFSWRPCLVEHGHWLGGPWDNYSKYACCWCCHCLWRYPHSQPPAVLSLGWRVSIRKLTLHISISLICWQLAGTHFGGNAQAAAQLAGNATTFSFGAGDHVRFSDVVRDEETAFSQRGIGQTIQTKSIIFHQLKISVLTAVPPQVQFLKASRSSSVQGCESNTLLIITSFLSLLPYPLWIMSQLIFLTSNASKG